MKPALSLTHKVILWLFINLAVLVAAGTTFMVWRYGVGWSALVAGPAGEHLRSLSSLVATDLRNDPAQDLEALLRSHQPGRAQLALYINQDEPIGGTRLTLPASIHEELVRRPPANAAAPDRPPEDRKGKNQPGPKAPANDPAHRPPNYFFMRSADTGVFWLGLRMPVPRAEDSPPSPGTLVVMIPSAFDLLLMLEFGPWFAAVAVAFVLSVLCWLPLVTTIRRDLLALATATEHLAEGRFDTRVAATRRDELGTLATAVNRMAERLDSHAQGQKRFLGDVAHELGSPLARLQLTVELLERRAAPELHPAIADVRDEVQQIAALVNELLAFTKAGLRPRDAALETVELAPLLTEIIEREGASGRVSLQTSGRHFAKADPLLLGRALGNLVRNALRYGGPDGAITIQVAPAADTILVTIADEGPGVPPEALARLGEPFFRPETARTRETGGVGLGLAIVRSAITACGGRVRFANREPRGFVAEVTLQAA